MSISADTIKSLEEGHWALRAIGPAKLARAMDVARVCLVKQAIGGQMTVDFAEKDGDLALVERVATAYELAAIEGLDALLNPPTTDEGRKLRDQAIAGAFRAYELRRVLPIPADDNARVFHLLHDAALAYCGDRWTDLRRWLKENPEAVTAPSAAGVPWDQRMLYRLFECWIGLLRKNRWDDLDRVREIVAGLREDQKQHEHALLEQHEAAAKHAVAFRLGALYQWAKATEVLAVYMLQGEPVAVAAELDRHFEAAIQASRAAADSTLDVLLRWLHVAARRMVAASVWWVAQAVNSRVTKFVRHITKAARPMFELLPPQRAALQEQGLLDSGKRAVIVNLPTSGGKTALAQFRILQALNQFDHEQGWIAYIAPTRALVSQLTRRLRTDFEPLGINVEQLTPAIDLDGCERLLLASPKSADSFHVLVATPEKLNLVIRNKIISRPLALVVLDEAHNLEDSERGLRIELLLATIKRDCQSASFLLLMPFVPNANELSTWLGAEQGQTITLGTTAWQPNERLVGIFDAKKNDSVRAGWTLEFETLTTTPRAMHLRGVHQVGGVKPLQVAFSGIEKKVTLQAGAMAKVFSDRGTSIAIASRIDYSWSLAREVAKNLPVIEKPGPEIELVQKFLAAEFSPDFELIGMLGRGVGVHHAGLSEETRSLIEWLAENSKLRVLCATTTIAQGINFPVASVFLATRKFPYGVEMSKRAFWNLAGRAGRVGQDSVGVVGLAAGDERAEIMKYVADATENLVSRLIEMMEQIDDTRLENVIAVLHQPQWSDFRSYIAHLWNEQNNLHGVLAETETVLRNTLGFSRLQASVKPKEKAKAAVLLEATKAYATQLGEHPENAKLADSTGFDPEGVRAALLGLNNLTNKLKPSDWQPDSLFGGQSKSALPQLVGVMMEVPQLRHSLEEIGGAGVDHKHIAHIAHDWVAGKSFKDIAQAYFSDGDKSPAAATQAMTDACRGIYRALASSGTWGLAALSRMPTSGLNFDQLTPEDVRRINNLPAMLYHGVNSESAVLMRLNAVPRSIATKLGDRFAQATGNKIEVQTVRQARLFLRSLKPEDWQKATPKDSPMNGADYREVWAKLSGEEA